MIKMFFDNLFKLLSQKNDKKNKVVKAIINDNTKNVTLAKKLETEKLHFHFLQEIKFLNQIKFSFRFQKQTRQENKV